MKLASRKHGRDGELLVVTRDLARAASASDIRPTLQAALDDWTGCHEALAARHAALESGEVEGFAFKPTDCAAPLPRAFQWADGSAYVNHVELVRRARGAEMPPSFWEDPLIYQGGSDDLLGPCDDIVVPDEAYGIDLEGEIGVITDDVPMGPPAERALDYVRLVVILNDVSLRKLIPGELAKGFGFYQSKPATAFSPVAVTPDELGDAWRDGKLHLPLVSHINGDLFGRPDAGVDMTFSFARLIAHAARTRNLCAGTIIGSGTVSNRLDGGPGRPVAEGGVGYSCLAEQRTVETLLHGEPRSDFLKFGDRVRIEMLDAGGHTIFGAIEQRVVSSGQP